MRSSYVLNKHQYINTVVILVCNDLVILACLHFVNRLVAVIPGIQLLVSGVIVDAAMAGVTFREEHHRTLIAAQGTGWHREKKVVCHVDTVCMYVCRCILCMHVHVYKPTCEWCHGCHRDTVWWNVLHSVCCRPHKGCHILGKLLQRHGFYTVCPTQTLLPRFLTYKETKLD